MYKSIGDYKPRARQDELVVEGLGDETLVYDMRNHKAHCLNQTAAAVWNRCDGKATVSELRAALEAELDTGVGADMIWLALDQLGKARLLSERLPGPISQTPLSRRAAMKRLGLGAAIALPLVTSILAPTTAEASTCSGVGSICRGDSQCCSSFCACNDLSHYPCAGGAPGVCQ